MVRLLPQVVASVKRRRIGCLVDSIHIVAAACDSLAIGLGPTLAMHAAAKLAERESVRGPIRPPESLEEEMAMAPAGPHSLPANPGPDGGAAGVGGGGAMNAEEDVASSLDPLLGQVISCICRLHDQVRCAE